MTSNQPYQVYRSPSSSTAVLVVVTHDGRDFKLPLELTQRGLRPDDTFDDIRRYVDEWALEFSAAVSASQGRYEALKGREIQLLCVSVLIDEIDNDHIGYSFTYRGKRLEQRVRFDVTSDHQVLYISDEGQLSAKGIAFLECIVAQELDSLDRKQKVPTEAIQAYVYTLRPAENPVSSHWKRFVPNGTQPDADA